MSTKGLLERDPTAATQVTTTSHGLWAYRSALILMVLGMTIGTAWAASTGLGGLIRACVTRSTGGIRIVSLTTTCRSTEYMLEWDSAGSGGATGGGATGGGATGGGGSQGSSLIFFSATDSNRSDHLCYPFDLYPGGYEGSYFGTRYNDTICADPDKMRYIPMIMASNGELTSIAVLPRLNTLDGSATLTVMVNGVPTALRVTVPPGSETPVVLSVPAGSVRFNAGDTIYYSVEFPLPNQGTLDWTGSLAFRSN